MSSQTPSQTVGPFFSHALTPSWNGRPPIAGTQLADERTPGTLIRIEGRVLDGAGDPVTDALVEIWQARHDGAYPDGSDTFYGFGRASTDAEGRFWFQTVKPGALPENGAPHVNAAVFARGMLNHAFTRIYFSDEQAENSRDPVLASIGPARRKSLVASLRDSAGPPVYDFEICLQGVHETVFFDA
ncbi:MAG: protocatechuate 3,4-dioxygenase subunit alpha [Bryobacterales bacterium]|nr:protocatechuate 3,4-dioxygenase subunit alpha [Bryobacterales bacterium]